MAKMKVGVAGIETISGALKKPKKQNGHNHGSYLIAVHRTAETTNPNCQRVYAVAGDAYVRTSPLSASEVAVRQKFTAVSRAVQARLQDLNQISADQAAFKAQKDLPGGKTTMRSYLWALEAEEYEANLA